jgi:drug/metabolite transporter (DMT)-like permease
MAMSYQNGGPRWSILIGIAGALTTALIWGGWPAFTRLSVTRTVTPEDLVALRYGIGGLILLPVLIKQADRIPRAGWREGIVLTVCQGAPLALLVTIGMRFAPASHMGALSPGLLPLFAGLLSMWFFNERLSAARTAGVALIFSGAVLMAGVSLGTISDGIWKGDLLFICAGMMGSIYTVRMRHSGLSAMQGAALIGVYSLIAYLPVYCWLSLGQSQLANVSMTELLLQAVYQGVLMGAVALFSLSRSVIELGAIRATAFISLVPVLGAISGLLILNEIPSLTDMIAIIAISLGVLLANGVALGRAAAPQKFS